MKKSAYLQQLDAHDATSQDRLERLQREFAGQPPLGWRPNATLDWGELYGVWVLVHRDNYSLDYTFRGPMVLIDDQGVLYRTKRRLKFKNGRTLDERDLAEYNLRPERMTLDEITESVRMLKELLAHERHRQEREEAEKARQQA